MNPALGVLAVGYGALLIYASLYPFAGWHTEGIDPFGFLTGGWPAVAPRVDNYVNVLAYLPLGLLLALCLHARTRFAIRVIVATLAGIALSFAMEYLQQYLPGRIASQADLATNACGTLMGALFSSFFDNKQMIGRTLARWRERWVKPGPQFSLGLTVLLAWALSQWLPGLPSFSVAALREGLAPAWHTAHDLSRFEVLQWARYALYLSGLALLAKTLTNPGRPALAAFFMFIAVVFGYKAAVMDRHLSLEAIAGALTAMGLAGAWVGLRVKAVAAVGAIFIFGGLLCAHFFPGSRDPQYLSNWAPLRGPIDHPTLGLGSVLEILWPPAALGYLARVVASVGSRHAVAWGGGTALSIFIVAVDWPQQSVPLATAFLMGATWAIYGCLFAERVSQPVRRPAVWRRA